MTGSQGRRRRSALNVERLALQIHDASFPADPDEDLGRGSPYSRGAERFCAWVADQGFDALQLGPQGMTSRGNSSPYDGTLFSRNPLNLPLARLAEEGRLAPAAWKKLRSEWPELHDGIAPYSAIFDAFQRATREIAAAARPSDRVAAAAFLDRHREWLVPDALYHVLSGEHDSPAWREWTLTEQGRRDQRLFAPLPGEEGMARDRLTQLKERHADAIDDYALVQWLLSEEHRCFRERLSGHGLLLFGDLQVGLSQQDLWARQSLFLPDYRVGAPPSRTNADGQPWGFAALDPTQYGTSENPGPVIRFVRARLARMLDEFDGVRIDHPHGWVDPWVYRDDESDPENVVRNGARLFSSPADPRHPDLARFAIARPDQIDPDVALHADGHVAALDEDQVRRYALLMDEIVAPLSARGLATNSIACEVLSTLPYPVGRVMRRHHLGRFRVTQKILLDDPRDVYRVENAQPEDWIMLGTHDTPPLWELAARWVGGEAGAKWAAYLESLRQRFDMPPFDALRPDKNRGDLIHALMATMLASPARHVAMFFADLFGMTARYNEPGVVNDSNWSLRVPSRFEEFHAERAKRGEALDLVRCVSLAGIAPPEGS